LVHRLPRCRAAGASAAAATTTAIDNSRLAQERAPLGCHGRSIMRAPLRALCRSTGRFQRFRRDRRCSASSVSPSSCSLRAPP